MYKRDRLRDGQRQQLSAAEKKHTGRRLGRKPISKQSQAFLHLNSVVHTL